MTEKRIKLKKINNESLVGTGNISINGFSGDYDDLTNKPSIPSKTSDLTNDSNFLTSHQDISSKEDKSNKVSSWSNTTTDTHYPSEKLVKDSLDGKANSTHNHTKSQITDFPTSMTPTSHTHGNLQNNGQVGSTAQASKNVVTDSSGKITTEDKPTIPSASSTTPSADTTNGSVGTGTTWARSNHTHPKSSLYAESSHNHTKSQITDFPSIPSKTSDLQNDSGFLTSHQDISGKEDTSNKVSSWSSTTTDTNYPSEKLVKDSLNNKQDKLVNCINIKTLEGVDLLGSGDITFDVSYDNPCIILEDKGSACGVSNYTTSILLEPGTNPIFTVKYSTTYNAYYYDITNTATGMSFIPINALTGITDDFKLQVDIMKTSNDKWTALGFAQSQGNGFVYGGAGSYWEGHEYQNNAWKRTLNHNTSNPPQTDTWYTYELIKEGNDITINCWDITHTTNYSSITRTWTDGTNYFGLTCEPDVYFNNVKAQYLNCSAFPFQLSTNKTELSYYDNESAILTAIYESGATMGLYNADTMVKIGDFTENNGTYTYTYNANGDGDVNLVAKVGSTMSDIITIEDCLFYGINTNAFTIPSNTIFSSDGEKITVTTSTSSEKQIYFNHDFNQSDDFLYEVEVAQLGTRQSVALAWNNIDCWGGQDVNGDYALAVFPSGDSGKVAHTFAVGDKFKIVKENGTTYAYINNTVFKTSSEAYNSTFQVGFYTNSGRTQYVKNIKIKLLNGVEPYSSNTEHQTENTIKLGDGILKLIDNTLKHMITNWEDYD